MINSKIKNLFFESWKLYSEKITYVISIYLLVSIIGGICNYIINQPGSMSSINGILFFFSSQLFTVGISLGLIKSLLLLNKNQSTTFADLFKSFNLIFKAFNASILFSLLVFLAILPGAIIILMSCDISALFSNILNMLDLSGGIPKFTFKSDMLNFDIHNQPMFLLGVLVAVINVIWISIKLQFYQYFIVDDECGAIKSLTNSFVMTNDKNNLLLQFLFFLVFINGLGLLFFGIGLIFTIPFSLLSMTKLYLLLKRCNL